MKPWLSSQETVLIESLLALLARNRPFLNCLEWGAGGSTVHFTRLLDDLGADYKWTSLEYDRQWFEKMKSATQKNPRIALVFFDIGSANPHDKTFTMDNYVRYPRSFKKKFDFIFVDGRKRRRCLLEAVSLVKRSGVVILHDASRPYYHCALAQYPVSLQPLPNLWLGFK